MELELVEYIAQLCTLPETQLPYGVRKMKSAAKLSLMQIGSLQILFSNLPEGGQSIEIMLFPVTFEVISAGTDPLIVEQSPDNGYEKNGNAPEMRSHD